MEAGEEDKTAHRPDHVGIAVGTDCIERRPGGPRVPVLISIPLVAFMLPVMIGTLMIPAVVRVVRDLVPAMTGG